VDAEQPTWLDPYAAQGPEEFFPVTAEAFFVAPDGLQAEFPEVYALLREYFGQDPVRFLR
jgi:Mlc titration factor MtfA (ptsG expression regulator)